jgi:hypothetical protein
MKSFGKAVFVDDLDEVIATAEMQQQYAAYVAVLEEKEKSIANKQF